MKKFCLALLAVAVALAISPAAMADHVAYSTVASQGSQTFDGNLANFFTANSALTINLLGVYNASGSGSIGGSTPIDVAIYNVTTSSLVASATFAPGAYYEQGYYVYLAIAPVNLVAGDVYEIDAAGFDTANPNGNINEGSAPPTLNNFDGGITWETGYSTYSFNTILALTTAAPPFSSTQNAGVLDRNNGGPNNIDSTYPALYDAGSFGVPEGGSAMGFLLLAAAVMLGAMWLSKPATAV
ncbi:MAG: hypothetical protein ABSG11_22095 [Candidatus Korobacteraceae bacterium]|jgi:hypothetical protein